MPGIGDSFEFNILNVLDICIGGILGRNIQTI